MLISKVSERSFFRKHRTPHARLRCFRKNDLSLDEAGPKEPGPCQALDYLSSQPQGSYRPRWISSPFPRPPSACFTASLSSGTKADAFCTSTSPNIPQRSGSSNSRSEERRVGKESTSRD